MRTSRKQEKEARKSLKGITNLRTVATPDEEAVLDILEANVADSEYAALEDKYVDTITFLNQKYALTKTDAWKYVEANALPGEEAAWLRNQLGIGTEEEKAADLQVVQAFIARQPQQVKRSGWFVAIW